MRINSVTLAAPSSVSRSQKVSNPSFNGFKENFSRAVLNANQVEFAVLGNKSKYEAMYQNLMSAANGFPAIAKKDGFRFLNVSCNPLDVLRNYHGNREAHNTINAVNNIQRDEKRVLPLLEYEGKEYIRMANLGPYYNKGLFGLFPGPYEQYVIEFYDPASDKFVGFSQGSELGTLAVTRSAIRHEFYNDCNGNVMAISNRDGYTPRSYIDIFDRQGHSYR